MSDVPRFGEGILLANVHTPDEIGNDPNLSILQSILNRGDIRAAIAFVDALTNATRITPATERAMKDRIWRAKAKLMVEYSEKIRQAIASSDFDAVKDYSERMRRLTAADQPTNRPTSTDRTTADETTATVDPAPPAADQSTPDPDAATESTGPDPMGAPEAGDSAALVRLRQALQDGRLFPPAETNAFDLAMAELSAKPEDPDVTAVLREVIERQQARLRDSLREGRPEAAARLADQLRDALERPGAETAWSTEDRSRLLGWLDQIRPDLVAGLIADTERAIAEGRLTVATDGKTSAQQFLDLVASQLGREHADVTRLATDILTSYRDLVGERLVEQRYDDALTLQSRMAAIATRYGVLVNQVAALKDDIETSRAEQQQHDQLLLLAAHWRDKGQLIKPAGANALEFAGKALRLASNPDTANRVLDELVMEQRRRIDRLIETDRLRQAAGDLRQLAVAIERIDSRRAAQADEYHAEAEQLLQQADFQDNRRQRQLTRNDVEDPVSVAPSQSSDDERSTFIFVNPF